MDKLKNLPPQYKLLIGIGALGLVAGIFYYLVIMDAEEKMGQQQNAYKQAQKELDKYKDFRGEVEVAELREQYAQVIKKIEENRKIIPMEENLEKLMSGLESDAAEAGLEVLAKDHKSREYEDYYFAIPIKLEVRGSLLQLVKFMKLIALPNKRLVNVQGFDIKVAREKEGGRKGGGTPFGGTGKVAAPESRIEASFVVRGFTYTGEPAGARKKKN